MRYPIILLLLLFISGCKTIAQTSQNEEASPKLVVGIVIDQMRHDYLSRYWNDYSDQGFKRLMAAGFTSHDHHFSYAPTYTGPGHASIYCGTTPEVHGITGNEWFDRESNTVIYCAKDTTVLGVGTDHVGGQMSPIRLHSSSICDQLELATNGRSKTVGISIKDRGAILPAGHSGDAAYWFMGNDEGNWVSSSWYMESLPEWVESFNSSGLKDELMAQTWDLLHDEEVYDESYPDNNPYEGKYKGKSSATFPYNLSELSAENGHYNLIKVTPSGNEMVAEFAKQAILSEEMGKDEYPDLISISFSSTDYVGHKYGPMARETQDAFLRMDLEIADLLDFIDENVGLENTIIFLTSDHGGAHVPNLLKDRQQPTGIWKPGNMVEDVEAMLNEKYGEGQWLSKYFEERFYLNRPLIKEHDVNLEQMQRDVADFCLNYEGAAKAFTAHDMTATQFTDGLGSIVQRGFHQKIAADVLLVLEPGWIEWGQTGTHHGSPYSYDTHTPLIMSGYGIEQGESYDRTNTRDIAPTVSALLRIQAPNGCTGRVISEAIK